MILEGLVVLALTFVFFAFRYFTETVLVKVTRPLLILDMNNVLVYRAFAPTQAKEKPESVPFNDQATLLGGKFYTWKRPHLDSFIEYCFNNFTVAVWSSALGHNVNDLVDFVFGDRKSELLFVWDQKHCDAVTLPDPANPILYQKPLFKKPLAKVWAVYPEYDETNTLLMDDSAEKVQDNPPLTWINVKPWRVEDQNDTVLVDMKM